MSAWWLTWLWQGLALALATGAAFRLLPRVNAATRYWIWWITLGTIGSLGSFVVSGFSRTVTGTEADATRLFLRPSAPDTFITIALGIWAVITLFGLLRVAAGVRAVVVLRDRCRPLPAGLEAQLPLWLEARRHGRDARSRSWRKWGT